MRKVLVVTSGRADGSPLVSVVDRLRELCHVNELRVGGPTLAGIVESVECEIDCLRPDIMLVLGDRFETLAACLAATYHKVPIAHIHGGESTYGAFDDAIRHAISKLSHLHFVAAQPYKERLESMGERRIWVSGAPGLDNLKDLPPRKPTKTFVVTYHPETLGDDEGLVCMLAALDVFSDYKVLWTGINNDPGNDCIREWFADYEHEELSLTLDEYLTSCRNAAAVVGNSSSGIIEAPSMGVPTVNIGTRQDGRIRAPSVFDPASTVKSIEDALRAAIAYDGPFENPCEGPRASELIAETVAIHPLDDILVKPW